MVDIPAISGLDDATQGRVMLLQSGRQVHAPALRIGLQQQNDYLDMLVASMIGTVIDYAGTTEPMGWLFCYGQAISRTTYSALFAVLSTTYGVGDGSTTFNLPDLRGRVVAGQDDMGGSSANRLTGLSGGLDGDVLGAIGGAETHTLTIAQMPAHDHTLSPASVVANTRTTGSLSTWVNSGSTNTTSTGGGGAHNNVQPTIILNKMIFAGV